MNINEFARGERIPIIESGSYAGVCCGIIDLGTQQSVYNGEERFRSELLIVFEIPDELIEINGESKPRQVSRRFTKSVHENSSFRGFLKSWRGHDFTEAELQDFDMRKMLGVSGVLNVVHNVSKSNGNTYAYLDGVVKLMKGMSVGDAENLHYFNIGMEESWQAFAKLPDWVKETINKSEDCKHAPFEIDENGFVSSTLSKPNSALLDDGSEDISFVEGENSIQAEANEPPPSGPDF